MIDARLDHESRSLGGRLTLTWRNITTAPAADLRFHLYWNAWRDPQSSWLTERRLARIPVPPGRIGTGGIDISRLVLRPTNGPPLDLTAQIRFIAPDDGNRNDRTLIRVPLPQPVAPQETIAVEMEWSSRVPRPISRTGYAGDYYFVAHWFPKIGVLEDGGWAARQFHAATEFYSDFGTYDVRLTLPAPFVVGATGREVSRTSNADGTATHRYVAEDVHDFAWAASPAFQVVTSRFEHPGLPAADIRLLILPEHADQKERHIAATRTVLRKFGEWFGPYPYGYITVVDPAYQSVSAAMEYPTLFTLVTRWLSPERVTQPQPDALTVHEAGHQFWQGLVATNEVDHAWMDEGLVVYLTAKLMEEEYPPSPLLLRFFGGFIPWVLGDATLQRETDGNRLPGYRNAPSADIPSTPTYRYWPATANLMSYNKTALWLHTLEREIGWPAMQRALAAYFKEWKFRHPQPAHLFGAISSAAGRDLSGFLDLVYRSSGVLDYRVEDLHSEEVNGRYRTTVVVERAGGVIMPVDIRVSFADGTTALDRWDGDERRTAIVLERSSAATAAEVDPERKLLLDVNLTNNSRSLDPRGSVAARKWSLKWMVWLQDLMLTYALFA